MTLVSVIIPTHNRWEMLSESLASVRQQTFGDYEIIVVSNGENAESRKLSRAAATRYGAHYFEIEEGNVSVARNFGTKLAHGKWIAFLDDDDIWLPQKLERQIAEAERTGADMIVCANVELLPDGSERLPREHYPDGWHHQDICRQIWPALPSSTMISKAALNAAGGFDPKQKTNEDCDLWRRVSCRYEIHRMSEILTKWRRGHVSLSGDKKLNYRLVEERFMSMQPENRYWFQAKRYGWGWGLPRTWQGWLVLAAFIGLVMAGTVAFPPSTSPVLYSVYVLGLVVLLLGVCWLKGEPPRWRWGNGEQ